MCGEPARRTENREVTSAATAHVTSGKGSPPGAEDPSTTYLVAERDFSLCPPSLTTSRPPARRAPSARPFFAARAAGSASCAAVPRGPGPRGMSGNYTRHLFQLRTAPPQLP